MDTYKISIVAPEHQALWREFWISDSPSKKAKKAGLQALLGQNVLVEANNLDEAIRLVARDYPNMAVMREGSSRIG